MTILDISPPLSANTPVFPGDAAFSARRNWEISDQCPVNVSAFSMSTHAGAHADAPLHYGMAGAPVDELPLAPYLGPCAVIHALQSPKTTHPVDVVDITSGLSAIGVDAPERLLIKTYDRTPAQWDPDFRAISPAAIDHIANLGVKLIGVDTASLDPASSKTMDAHNAVARADMRILECLVLDDVAPGVYELIALPLKLVGLDAAPVRAILRTLP